MNKMLLLPLLALLSNVSMAAGFDCRKAHTFIEQAICHNKELSDLDDALGVAYKKALVKGNQDTLIVEQKNWLKTKRNSCDNAMCLKKAYQLRITELNHAGGSSVSNKAHNSGVVESKPAQVQAEVLDAGHTQALKKTTDLKHHAESVESPMSSQNWEQDIRNRIEKLIDKK